MTIKKPKKNEKRQIPLRVRGEVLTPAERPSKTLFDAVLKAEEAQEKAQQEPTTHPNPSQDNPSQPIPTHPKQKRTIETSPSKNFTKVPNSTLKNAIPEKLFKGLSKHTYDILYHHTRGAITPVREIQLTKLELQKLTGLSENTVSTHIKNLRDSGLIATKISIGKHEGSVYEVFVYEELDALTHPNPSQPIPTQDKTTQKLVPIPTQKLGRVGEGNPIENIDTYGFPKTLYKTNTSDDEAFADFISKFSGTVEKITGKKPHAREREQWGSLADLLVLELEIAASRTGNIASVPAFLTEVLRRQFFSARRERKSSVKPASITPDTVGKSDLLESFEIKLLDEQGREAALEQLREFAGESFLDDFRKWYTPADWQWLTERLKISENEKRN